MNIHVYYFEYISTQNWNCWILCMCVNGYAQLELKLSNSFPKWKFSKHTLTHLHKWGSSLWASLQTLGFICFSFQLAFVKVLHCDFNFHFPDELEKIFVNALAIEELFLIKCLSTLVAHFSRRLSTYWRCISILCIFWILALWWIYILSIFSFTMSLIYYSLNCISWLTEVSNLNRFQFIHYFFF